MLQMQQLRRRGYGWSLRVKGESFLLNKNPRLLTLMLSSTFSDMKPSESAASTNVISKPDASKFDVKAFDFKRFEIFPKMYVGCQTIVNDCSIVIIILNKSHQ